MSTLYWPAGAPSLFPRVFSENVPSSFVIPIGSTFWNSGEPPTGANFNITSPAGLPSTVTLPLTGFTPFPSPQPVAVINPIDNASAQAHAGPQIPLCCILKPLALPPPRYDACYFFAQISVSYRSGA